MTRTKKEERDVHILIYFVVWQWHVTYLHMHVVSIGVNGPPLSCHNSGLTIM